MFVLNGGPNHGCIGLGFGTEVKFYHFKKLTPSPHFPPKKKEQQTTQNFVNPFLSSEIDLIKEGSLQCYRKIQVQNLNLFTLLKVLVS